MAIQSLATSIIASATATLRDGLSGEAIIAGEILYFDVVANRWLKADADMAAKAAAGAVALNSAPSAGQPLRLLTEGLASGFSGLKPGSVLMLSNTPGDLSDAVGDLTEDVSYSTVCGIAYSASSIYFKFHASGVLLNLV